MKKILFSMMLCASAITVNASAAQFGACTHMGLGNNYDNITNVQTAKDVNISWVRDECRWGYMQSGANGKFQIRQKDLDYIKKVDEAGINQLLILAYGNTSYNKEKDTDFPTQDDLTYYNGFLDYVRYAVSTVGEYVDAYELWNEPNISSFNYELQASGTDYAKLYLDVKQIVDELDPDAILLGGSITGAGTSDLNYAKEIFNHIKSQGDVNSLIDAFSIHIYNNDADGSYANALNKWEELFDSYGFTGDVWMTENGVSSNTDNNTAQEQASYIARVGARWENYLNMSGRNGVNFWYDLRCDGTDAAEYEHNLGLVDYDYEPKPAFYAMKAYNDLTLGKEFENFTSVKTKDNWISSDEYGYYAQYSDDDEDVYIVYDTNNNNGKISIPLSRDVVYVYDYLGNLTETITNPSGSKSIDPGSEACYVRCVDVEVAVDSVEYDEETAVVSVQGSYNHGDSVTVELVKDSNVLVSREAQVKDGKFDMWFTQKDAGEYVLRVGKPEFENLGMTTGWAEQNISVQGERVPQFDASTNVSYDEKSKTVMVNGKIAKYSDNQMVTLMAIPESMDVNNVDFEALAYVGQVDVTDGAFSVEFVVPDYFETKMAIYLGGTDIASASKNNADVKEGQYVYVAGLDMSKGDTLSSAAIVRNFTDSDKKATMIIAQYDNSGKLLNMKTVEKTIPAKTYKAIECSLKDVLIESGADSAKAFIFSDMMGIVPLAEFAEQDI